jgi:amidohydrolase
LSLCAVTAEAGAQDAGVDLASLTRIYRYLHEHPELSGQEEQTSRWLAGELRQLGFEVTADFGEFNNPNIKSYGVVAVMNNGQGPVVMVRTDLDALPIEEKTGLPFASRVKATSFDGVEVPVMHACGHDLHMTCFLGTARKLAQARDRWRGTLIMIGQPAEETGSGARAMLRGGLYSRFPKPDFAIALHTSAQLEAGRIAYCPGPALAGVDSVDVILRGRGGHGAYPHTAKDPIVLAAQFVMALQTIVSREVPPLDSAVVTVGSIHGGTKYNIIPDDVRLQITVREYKPEIRQRILSSIERIAKGLALAAGAPAPTVKLGEEYTPATINDVDLTERLAAVWKRELGAARVTKAEPVMGAEDFANYPTDGVRGCIFWLGALGADVIKRYETNGEPLPSLHSSDLAPDVERAIPTGVEAMTAAALELLGKTHTTDN